MCRRVDCAACGRPTFAGCGAHVEQVLAGVPASERCRCGSRKPRPEATKGREGILGRLLRGLKA